jgi:hypothetical protein
MVTSAPDTVRTMMNEDVADGLLLDVRGVSMADLLFDDDESGLTIALNRLLTSSVGTNFNSFGSSI